MIAQDDSPYHVVLDTETTGLSFASDRIIEIGCIKLKNKTPVSSFHSYIKPGIAIHPDAQRVHGITSEFLYDKPTFVEVYHDFLAFVDGSTLVIHNAPFDMGFLQAELDRVGHPDRLDRLCHVIDTLTVARKMFPGQKNTLDALCGRFGIDLSHRSLHGALKDADLLVKVFVQLTTHQQSLSLSDSKKHGGAQDCFRWTQSTELIRATDDELALHEQWLAQLKD
ncbi:MAG: DNA polymerase III subunit epsilon [Pseudomonadota bacterium]|nr:DNA polymerase III subunit epsilon [Pseudomonadota bacterium]